MGKEIIVVGSYIVALVMDTEKIPVVGETLMGRNYRQTYGGKGSNQAVQAARLGAPVAFIGEIGNDSYGSDFIGLCEREGIDHKFVFSHESLPTATGFIICAQGQNIITINSGALSNFSTNEIDRAEGSFTDQSVVLIQLEIPLETALYAAKKAKEKGAKVIVNPAPAIDLSGLNLSFIDYLTPNETEARICAGLSPNDLRNDREIGKMLLNSGCKNVIITLGEKGSLLINSHEETLVHAFNILEVVDSTGAGDAFNAGFATGIMEGFSVPDAILLGNAAGGLSCKKADTIPSYHSREEVTKFMTKLAY